MTPNLVNGNCHKDPRGFLFYNNDFDLTIIKRMYVIENSSIDINRAWQGHQIEQRWFSAMAGSFVIQLIAIDNWDRPDKKSERFKFVLDSKKLDVLHIPAGYVSSIQSLAAGSKLLVMADYLMGVNKDDYRYESGYFE